MRSECEVAFDLSAFVGLVGNENKKNVDNILEFLFELENRSSLSVNHTRCVSSVSVSAIPTLLHRSAGETHLALEGSAFDAFDCRCS